MNRLLRVLDAGRERATHVEVLPARAGLTAPWPDWADSDIVGGYQARGIGQPWRHQVEAAEAAWTGHHTIVATSTGSGKSLALWLPALTAARARPVGARISQHSQRPTVLYLAPTKALAADQLSALKELLRAAQVTDIAIATCDGDADFAERTWAQQYANIILTNPDYLHFSLLARHAYWTRFLRGLRYVVVDECHAYRGVFGAHVALVLRRLLRLARHYGADPVVLFASATVREPTTLAARLIGAAADDVVAVQTDTAPAGRRTVVLWEPPALIPDDETELSQDGWLVPPPPGPPGQASQVAATEPPPPSLPGADQAADDAGAQSDPPPKGADHVTDDPVESSPPPHKASQAADRAGAQSDPPPKGAGQVTDDPVESSPPPDKASQAADDAGDVVEAVVRRSATAECAGLLAELVEAGAHSLAFVRSRFAAESVAEQVRGRLGGHLAGRVSAYRGGYLPEERRELETRLRDGSLLGLVTTTALELGIDIAGLDAVLIAGWPGTRVSLWQQIGRAGRAGADGLAIWIAGTNPLDSYVVRHPETVFGAALEATAFDPANPYVLAPHLCAAAAELPLTEVDAAYFGPGMTAVLGELEAQGALRRRPSGWYWTLPDPATALTNLRGSGGVAVQVIEGETGRVLGTVDGARADSTVHAGAVYVHQGESYVVTMLDLEGAAALVRRAEPRYRTMANDLTTIAVVGQTAAVDDVGARWHLGRLTVRTRVISYTRLRLPGLARLDTIPLDLPERVMETTGCWWTMTPEVLARAELAPDEIPGALHAAEHAAIGLLPLLATCDRWDLGGLSTANHPDTGLATIFIHDALAGGAGFAEQAFAARRQLLQATRDLVAACPCAEGCPSCIQSPKCGNANQILNKAAASRLLAVLTQGE